jgi:hypothetical protein
VVIARDHVRLDASPAEMDDGAIATITETAERMKQAGAAGKSVILAFGAHAIKRGLGPVLIDLMERGLLTHLATNGAGVIHDWEFAFLGESSEDVRTNVDKGEFGIWQETGYYINLAIAIGAYRGLGYGESVGAMIENESLEVPAEAELLKAISDNATTDTDLVAAAADLLGLCRQFELEPGTMSIPHPHKEYSVQAAAYRLGIPFTGHPMIGHDIIYTHPVNHGGAIGRTGLRDFLTYADSVNNLDGGVYMSIGSAVMSPMIFEKALSMCQNVHIQDGKHIDNHFIVVVDLTPVSNDWRDGKEPFGGDAAFYIRFNKTFSRMGGTMRYVCADNRDFLLSLHHLLSVRDA